MQDEVLISVENLKKRFKVYIDKGSSLKEKLLFFKRNRYENRWVLNGISFRIRRGEAVGLIGRNGCGKSTTLKLLTRIMYPTSGDIKIKGRVSSLIELGAGFHPDMSGRENIYTNASIFGLTKKQIDARIEDIIAFSELEEYIDNPVRTYSSGMYMRLAFSVAINVEADILLIDEILAVGDVSFQKKCFEKLQQIKAEGTTIVIVSHALEQIEEICDRTIWIEEGHIRMEDVPLKVHKVYAEEMEQERLGKCSDKDTQTPDLSAVNYFMDKRVLRFGKGEVKYTEAYCMNSQQQRVSCFLAGEEMKFQFSIKNDSPFEKIVLGLRIYTEDNILCFGTNTACDLEDAFIPLEGLYGFSLLVKGGALLPGSYFADIDINDETGMAQDTIHNAFQFEIKGDSAHMGILDMDADWEFYYKEEEE